MKCKECGKEIPDGAKYCSGCGAKSAPDNPTTQGIELKISSAKLLLAIAIGVWLLVILNIWMLAEYR
ncbi:MAG: zinc ribbon domain-containing protein [Bacteroides sp.]|nr:zinc ribbon domain-containing protein [Bacteroides sp.]MCM1086025.1 zinc ribbon domain-containing protein [Bacteroides sp.]